MDDHPGRPLDEILRFYRGRVAKKPPQATTMLTFLRGIDDLLRSHVLYYNRSQFQLAVYSIPKSGSPCILINAGDGCIDLCYHEIWFDGSKDRTRRESIMCPLEESRECFLELFGRLRAPRTDDDS